MDTPEAQAVQASRPAEPGPDAERPVVVDYTDVWSFADDPALA
jgi:hypothetical protein